MDQQARPVPSKSRSKGKKRRPPAAQKHQAPLDGSATIPRKSSSSSGLDRNAPARYRGGGPASGSESDASSVLSERSGTAAMPQNIEPEEARKRRSNAITLDYQGQDHSQSPLDAAGRQRRQSDKNKRKGSKSDPNQPQKTEEEKKQEDQQNEGYNAELQEELRIQQLKKQILADDQENLHKLRKQYAKEQTYDGSHGQCCCTWQNEKGANIIQWVDAVGILVCSPRAMFAIWSLVDDEKVEIYARVRLITFWILWVAIFVGIVGFAFFTVFQNDDDANQFYLLLSLAELAVVVLLALADYHWCKVISFWALGAPKRRKHRQKEERKAWRAQERQRRSQAIHYPPEIADGQAEDGLGNPIVVPEQKFTLEIPSEAVEADPEAQIQGEQEMKASTRKQKSKKSNHSNHNPYQDEESHEQRRQPSQRKKNHKRKKSHKSRDVSGYDDEFRINDEYAGDDLTAQGGLDGTKDPASLVGNSLMPLAEPVESRHGGSQRVRKSTRKKKKSRTHTNQLDNFDDDFNGFD